MAGGLAAAVACMVLAAPVLPGPVLAEPDPVQVTEALRRAAEELAATGRYEVAGERLLSARTLPRLYAGTGFRLLWPPEGQAEALLGEIAASEGDGLNPADYHFDVLIATLERRRAGSDDAAAAVEADLLLTDALVRLVAHLVLGKLEPEAAPRWDLPDRLDDRDTVELLKGMLRDPGLALRLGDLRPAQPVYGRLKAALARYRIIARDSGWPSIGPGPVLRLDATDTRVATVRRRLALTGDFVGEASDSPTYDGRVMSAIQNFQRRHGLETDGLLGPATRAALNRPVERRIDEIRANLERARQLLGGLRGRFLLVDPAAGQVVAASDGNVLDMQPAAFGEGVADGTPLRSRLAYVVVNPDWTLPSALVEGPVAALGRADPGRFDDLGLSVFTDDGRREDPRRVNWSRPAGLIVRQAPGESSFLGAARLAFPNEAGLTIHGRGGGAFTGAVSVPDPIALAAWAIGSPEGRSALDAVVASGRTRSLVIEAPVAVIVAPWTAWAEADGSVSFRPGFEAADAVIVAGLAAGAR